jgi:glycosyltransferase involved in cell wall biosynthesis
LVVGEGELRGILEELAHSLGIAHSIRFTGFRNDISRLIGAMDLLVLPTKNEGFPWVLAEAMSLGKPVVATRVGGIPELVQDGHTGLLVPPGDGAALGTAIAEILGQPGRARQMGLAGRRRVRERFGVEKMLDRLEELFSQVIEDGGLRGGP